ncbi:MAG: hypothetical protein JSS63_07555 [Bacteroidetes bacterium]|nr:hypothetical protein [Bacteroidota bacterium]
MQKSIIYFVLILTGCLTLSSCSLFSPRYEKIEKGEYRISANGKKRFTLNNIDGKIKIVRTTDAGVIIVRYEKVAHVKKRDLNTPLNEIKLNIDSSGADVKIDTEMESINSHIRIGIGESNKVDYEIFIPEGIEINLNNTNGSITAKELDNNIKASTVNGDIKLEKLSGKLELETTNGSIRGTIDSTKGIKAETMNGSIKFSLGTKVSATVKADVMNGSVKTEGLNFKNSTDRKERKYFHGTLGNGDAEIKLETTNGSIRLTGDSESTEI